LKDSENLEPDEKRDVGNEGAIRGSRRVRTKGVYRGVVKRNKTMRIGKGERHVIYSHSQPSKLL
jgi:hypothetical protein